MQGLCTCDDGCSYHINSTENGYVCSENQQDSCQQKSVAETCSSASHQIDVRGVSCHTDCPSSGTAFPREILRKFMDFIC